jgi:hypothetical protein
MEREINPYSSPVDAVSSSASGAEDPSRSQVALPLLRSLSLRGKIAAALLLASITVSAAFALNAVIEIKLYLDAWNGTEYDAEYHANINSGYSALNCVAIALWLPLVVSCIAWMYKSHQNLSGLNVGQLKHTSGTAIWSWFVPLANFWVPYQIMSEIFNKSMPAQMALRRNPMRGMAVRVWWATWIAGSIFAAATNFVLRDAATDTVYVGGLVGLAVSNSLRVSAQAVSVWIILAVDANQAERRREVADDLAASISSVPALSSAP